MALDSADSRRPIPTYSCVGQRSNRSPLLDSPAKVAWHGSAPLPRREDLKKRRLSDSRKNLAPVFEGKQPPFNHYESIRMRIFTNRFEAWTSGITGPTGNALLVTAGLLKDPYWSVLLTAAGFSISQTTDEYLQVDRQVTDFWNNGFRVVSNPRNLPLLPSNFRLDAVDVVRVRQVYLWVTDEYGTHGFLGSTLKPVESPYGENLELFGRFSCL